MTILLNTLQAYENKVIPSIVNFVFYAYNNFKTKHPKLLFILFHMQANEIKFHVLKITSLSQVS